MKYIVLTVKGFIMGIANIIPGVSGGTIALILGIYEELVNRVSHIFDNLIDNIKYILPIFIGIALSLLIMSGVINYSYENFPLPTMMFFVGLVVGGIPMLYGNIKGKKESKKISNYFIFIITFGLVLFMSLSNVIFNNVGVVDLNNMSVDDRGIEMQYYYFAGTFETLDEAQIFIDTFKINETAKIQ